METAIYNDRPAKQKKATKARVEDGQCAAAEEPEVAEQESAIEQVAPLGEVEVRVVRIPANPRLLICESRESGLESPRILVKVRSNVKFRRGMELAAVPSASEAEPWVYEGRMPRFAGRW